MALRPRAVVHGIDMSVPNFVKLPDSGQMGSITLTEDLLGRFVYDAANAIWLPLEYFVFEYDFATDGGTVGAKTLSEIVPDNTIIWDGLYDVIDPFASLGAATIAISVVAANDILSAALITSAGTAGLHDIAPVGTAATAVKTAADTAVTLTIGGANLTGGKLIGYLRCLRGF